MLRVAIDTGGTFTDFVFQNLETGEKTFWKTPSTPSQPEQAVLLGLAHLTGTLGAEPAQVREILLATTVVTNAIIERKGSPTGLITTGGFRDVLIIGRQKRHDAYDLHLDKARPLVPRRNIVEVDERIAHDGEIIRPLDMNSVERAIAALLEKGVESIAVCLLHSYANPAHEHAIGEHLRALAPGVSVSLSCEVSPKYREYERTSTTVANAYVKPLLERYLDGLEAVFAEKGFTGELFAMQSNGGLMTPALARKFPVTIVESGPAAGVLMCSIVGRSEGFENVLTFDMGGTTAKVGAMEGGEPAITPLIEVDGVNMRKWSGLPLNILAIELIEIGAGGGSIAQVEMGLIRVGPESAGADPGPVCYGKGGRRVTLTDANLVLGYLNPDNFAGGSIALDLPAAGEAIRRQIADPLGISTSEAAWGIHAVANAFMERAMRSMSMERGRDPRNYTLVAFGGAGPLHGSRLARALGVPRVIVPWGAGVGSAVGLLDADPKFSASRTHRLGITEDNSGEIAAIYGELEQRIRNEVKLSDRAGRVDWRRFAYLRYAGQGYELKIDLPPGEIAGGSVTGSVTGSYTRRLMDTFHEAYEAAYGYSQQGNAIEATDWYLTAVIPTVLSSGATRRSPTGKSPAGKESAAAGEKARAVGEEARADTKRSVYFHELGGYVECRAVNRYALKPGDLIEGPAIIEERESTIVILPGDVARVTAAEHLILTSRDNITEDA